MSISPATPSSSCEPPWHVLPEVLRRVITHLPFPGDRARFRAVCRVWHSAAHKHVRQLPWIVFPDCSFCTIAGEDNTFFHRLPGLPEGVTCCLGAAGDGGWLALDCTDDTFRRTPHWDKFTGEGFLEPRHDVKHKHTYLLHNPFSGETTPLPELDDLFGHVDETLEIRKVLMRSSATTDDVVAVVTNNGSYCNVVLCRPGTDGVFVLQDFRVFDVEFMGGRLYGIAKDEDLLEFHLGEDDDNGSPMVTKCRRLIKRPMADGEEDSWSWMDNDNDDIDDCDDEEEDMSSTSSNDDEDDEDIPFIGDDDIVVDGEEIAVDDEVAYELKDYIYTTRRLVKSRSGEELMMVKHQMQVPPRTRAYTRKVEVFKADIGAGQWVPVATGDVLAEGEALFHSRSFSKSTRVYGDIEDGFIYSMDMDDVFDTRSGTTCRPFRLPRQWRAADTRLLTWLFPPHQLVV